MDDFGQCMAGEYQSDLYLGSQKFVRSAEATEYAFDTAAEATRLTLLRKLRSEVIVIPTRRCDG